MQQPSELWLPPEVWEHIIKLSGWHQDLERKRKALESFHQDAQWCHRGMLRIAKQLALLVQPMERIANVLDPLPIVVDADDATETVLAAAERIRTLVEDYKAVTEIAFERFTDDNEQAEQFHNHQDIVPANDNHNTPPHQDA